MITKEMTPLDIVERYPQTDPIFRTYDPLLGKCLLCHCLFDSLEAIAQTYELDLDKLIEELETAVRGSE